MPSSLRGLLVIFLASALPVAWADLIIPLPSQDSVTDYAPNVNVECPDLSTTSLIREFTAENQTLHPAEIDYVNTRASTVLPDAWSSWLGGNDAKHGYNLSQFPTLPKVGMAIPGGGLRAALYGAATLNALDARNDTAKAAGTGGLLQVTSYLTGLSGGSWVTGSMFMNNWPKIYDLVLGNGKDMDGWLLDLDLVTPDGINLFSDDNQYFFGSVLWSVMAKANTGIDTSLTDPWSRMIAYHFLNQTSRKNFFTNDSAHGAGQLWSEVPRIPAYQQHQTPFPIIVADSRPVGSNLTTILPLDSTVYEITPFELASYDPNLSAGMNLTYAGTHLTNGKPDNGSACVTGFDQVSFVMGSSASLFNVGSMLCRPTCPSLLTTNHTITQQLLDFAHNTIYQFKSADAAGLLYVLQRQLREVRTRADDVANWPSPFTGLKNTTFQDSDKRWIELIDGASNQENVPYGPLFVKARGLDVIVTIEGSADESHNFPNGTSPITTSTRLSTLLRSSHQQFPPIPQNADGFIATGVNARPTFFGCDPQHTPPEFPLVIYLPSAPPFNGDTPVINTATFKLSYSNKHVSLFFDQVFNNTISGFKPGTNLADPNFGTCLQCAAIDRARLKANPVVPRSDACSTCFKQYCFDPSNPPSKSDLPNRKLDFVDPDPQGLDKVENLFTEHKFAFIGGLIGLVVLIAALVGGIIFWRRRRATKVTYKVVEDFHYSEPDLPAGWQRYSDHDPPRAESYQLPNYR